jgi:UDP-N-acetylmuramate dehydrogenase
VLKNPPGQSAGRLIEAARLGSTRVGARDRPEARQTISSTSAARPATTCWRCRIAREQVLREFGVELELEVQVMG